MSTSSSLFTLDRSDEKTPVFVLTGFLGSGKTTLLNRMLHDPSTADTAVVVNELGDVALDHLLVERIDGEVVLLQSGCVCCAVRNDFEQTLCALLARRDEGSVPPFTRIAIETTGLADPAPLMQLIDVNPILSHFCKLAGVLTTVDAVHALQQLERQWEARKQVALADTLIVTKRDLVADTAAVQQRVQALNPHAGVQFADALEHPARLLTAPADAVVRTAREASRGALGVLSTHGSARPMQPLHGDVSSIVLEADTPLDWPELQLWLAEVRTLHGDRLLRLKAVVRVAGEPDPLVLHGVHHLFHPPLRAPQLDWPARRSVLVLIVRGLDADMLRAGFRQCLAAA